MTEPVVVRTSPSRVSAALATVSAALAVAMAAPDVGARLAAAATLLGLGVLGVGRLWHAGSTLRTGAATVLGAGVVLASLVGAALLPVDLGVAVGAPIGLLGTAVVGLALLPAVGDGSRGLLRVGTAITLGGVLTCGIARTAPRLSILLAGALVILSFDLGEHAVGIGEQLGRDARTTGIELAHALASGTVLAVGVGACLLVTVFDGVRLSLSSFVLLLVVVVLLTFALGD